MVLIVGATGYVGRYLSIYLKNEGYNILALGRSRKVQQFFIENDVPFQYFDMDDQASFDALPTQNVEAVIDLSACLAEHETPVERFFEVNTIGVYKMLEYCRKNNIKKFILSSSHKVYNDIAKNIISENDGISFKGDHSPYIISKIAAENFVTYYHKDFGIDGIVLRFTGVHGYGEILGHLNVDGTYRKSTFEIFFERILKGEKIEVWGDQSIVRDHIYVKDVLSAKRLFSPISRCARCHCGDRHGSRSPEAARWRTGRRRRCRKTVYWSPEYPFPSRTRDPRHCSLWRGPRSSSDSDRHRSPFS